MPIAEAIGIDTGMVHTAIAQRVLPARGAKPVEFIESLKRPDTGDLYCAGMMWNLRSKMDHWVWPCSPLTVVATERLTGMRGASEKNVVLQWAVIEGALEAIRQIAYTEGDGGDLRVVIVLPTPSQLKKFVTGKGNAEKSEVGRWIERRWPGAPMQEDEAEAYALMQFARCRREYELGLIDRDNPGEWLKSQVELAAKDLWSDAKSTLASISITGAEALALAGEFRDGAWSGERLIEYAAEALS